MVQINEKGYKARHGAEIYAAAIAFLMLFQFIMAGVLAATGFKEGTESYRTFSALFTLTLEAGFAAIFVLYNKWRSVRPQINLRTRVKWPWYAAALPLAIVCIVCFYPVAMAFAMLLDKLGFNEPSAFQAGGALNNIILALATVVAAPIAEELIFRGALLSGLSRKFRHVPAALLCALAFSFMHMNPAQTVLQFFLGLAACQLALGSGSVVPAIVLHSCNNLIALALTFADGFSSSGAWYKKALIHTFLKPLEAYERLLGRTLPLVTCCVFLTVLGLAVIALPAILKQKRNGKPCGCGEKTANKNPGEITDSTAGKNINNAVRDAGNDEKTFYLLYLGALGICALMWIAAFFS